METVKLKAIDGGEVRGFVARPAGDPKGCVVIAQEIFGVNDHVRWVVAEQYAKAGYLAVAPAFFDRLEPDVELGYTPEGTARGRELVDRLGMDAPLRDIRAAEQQVGGGLPTGVVGYCWGGSVAFLANTRLGLPAVSYYGARTTPFLDEAARAPMLVHFGADDASIPPEAIALHRERQPAAQVYVYAGAGHAFNRETDPVHHDPGNAALARTRTLAFLAEHAA